MKRGALGFGLSVLSVSCAFGMGHRPPELTKNPLTVEATDRIQYRAVGDDRGGFYAVWTNAVSTETFSLVIQHLDSKGAALWTAPGLTAASGLADPVSWDVFSDGRNGITLTWLQREGVKAQRFGPDGKALWEAGLVLNTSTSPVVDPAGMPDAAGGAFLVWQEKRYPGRWVLMIQHLNGAGVPIWNPDGQRVSLYPSDQRDPMVIPDGQSGVIVAWKEKRQNSSQTQAQRLDYQGNLLWGQEGVLVTAPAGGPQEPILLQPFGNGFTAAGWRGTVAGVNRLFLQGFGPEGHLLWNPRGQQFSTGAWEEWNSVLWGADDGRCWAGWEDRRDHGHWQIYVGALDKNGQALLPGAEMPLAPAMADQGHLSIVGDGHDGLFGVWLDNRQGMTGLYAQDLDLLGHRSLGERGLTIVQGLEKPLPPKIAGVAPGQAAVLWADQSAPGQWTLYWVLLASGGQP